MRLGLLCGLLAGWIAVVVAAPTRVSFNAAACPAGVYDVTAVASGEVSSASNVSLPRPTVELSFKDLPPTTHVIRATARRRSDRMTFASQPVTITGLGAPRPSLSAPPVRAAQSPAQASTGRAPAPITIIITLSRSTIQPGGTSQAVAKDESGKTLTGVEWSVEHAALATITPQGLITGRLTGPWADRPQGATGVTARIGSASAQAFLIVKRAP